MQKSHIIGLTFATAVAILFLGASRIHASEQFTTTQESQSPNRRIIRVSGTAVTYGKPDYATVMIGVTKSSAQLLQAKAACDQVTGRVQAAIKKAGVAAEDIQTASYDIFPVQPQNKPESARTWKVTHLLSIKVKKVAALSGVLDAAAGAGATNISRVDYGITDVVALRSKARTEAMRVALGKAKELAKIAGMNLSSPVTISEQFYGGYAQTSANSYMSGYVMADSNSNLSAGQNAVTVQVDVEYSMYPSG
jgi:uncharacterized protein YggE